MILSSFVKTLSQIGDPRFRRVLLLGVGLTVALLAAVYAAFLGFLQWMFAEGAELPIIGRVTWVDDLLGWGSLLLMLVLSVFLMVPVASAITSMFLDNVARAVEDRYYPNLAPPPKLPFWDGLKDTLNFLGLLVVANVLALFVYALFPPASILIFWALNGYLLGMEYFQMAAMRRLGRTRATALRKRNRGTIWLAGTLMAMPLSLPLVNLVIPILGAATFTHVFQAIQARNAPSG